MIIYKDIISGDEILSDTFNLKVVDNVFYEADCRKYLKKKNQDVQLEGANPSAEEAEDGGEEGEEVMVHDIEDQFRLVWLKPEDNLKPSKKDYQAHIKGYMKRVLTKLTEKGAPKEQIDEFKTNAPAAVKKILGNWDNYDVLMGESTNGDAMYVLIDFREDGVTPFATVWKHGLVEEKV
ncbi:Mss4-like protein [Aspergillus californicus]